MPGFVSLKIILVICVALTIVYLVSSGAYQPQTLIELREFVQSKGWLGPIIFVTCFAVLQPIGAGAHGFIIASSGTCGGRAYPDTRISSQRASSPPELTRTFYCGERRNPRHKKWNSKGPCRTSREGGPQVKQERSLTLCEKRHADRFM